MGNGLFEVPGNHACSRRNHARYRLSEHHCGSFHYYILSVMQNGVFVPDNAPCHMPRIVSIGFEIPAKENSYINCIL